MKPSEYPEIVKEVHEDVAIHLLTEAEGDLTLAAEYLQRGVCAGATGRVELARRGLLEARQQILAVWDARLAALEQDIDEEAMRLEQDIMGMDEESPFDAATI